MKGTAADAAAEGRPDDDGQREPGAPVGLRADVHDRVERAADEVRELQLGDRPLAHPGGAEGRADEALLGDRRVDHPGVAELVPEPLRDPERPAEVADVLAEEEHAPVVEHRVAKCGSNRLEVGDLAHGVPRPGRYATVPRLVSGQSRASGWRDRS